MSVKWLWAVAACAVACAGAERGGSSLRGALEALQRRQRGRMHPPMDPLPEYDALYEFVPPQVYPEPDYNVDVEDLDDDSNTKYIVKLLEENERPQEAYEYKLIKKKNSHPETVSNKKESAFRERSHHPDNDKLRELFIGKNDAEEKKELQEKAQTDKEYALLLGELWSKYKYDKGKAEPAPPGVVKLYKEKIVKKRYPNNWGPIAFKRKRSSDSDADRPISPDYETDRKIENVLDSNYNTYELPNDDKEDLREEYAIAFQPLDDDSLSDLADDDQYTYDSIEKRFPVTKRSSGPYDFNIKKKRFALNQNKRETSKTFRSSSGTDPKIIRDLSRVFGNPESEIKNPVKRSSDNQESHDGKPPMLPQANTNTTHEHHNSTDLKGNDQEHVMHHPGVLSKDDEHDNHQHDHNESEKPIIIKKKSIDWSDYFGIDKRKKSTKAFVNDLTQDKLRKQYFDTFNKEVVYPLNSFRQHSNVKRNYVQASPNEETEIEIDRPHAVRNDEKRDTSKENDAKLDSIDKKLKTMEGLIVDEALHYTNVGDDLDSKEEQEMKEKLLSRLAAAYSLEKMRKALKEFKQSLQTHRAENVASPIPMEEAKAKRVAVKKENVDVNSNEIPIYNKNKVDDFEGEQGAGHYLNGKTEEQFSEGYMGGSGRHRVPVIATGGPEGSCPVLAKIVQRCRGVDLLAGDRGQLFLPLCSLHQICYLCGEAPPTTCDLVFLSEADTTCEGDMSCQRAARSALMALRELHDNLADELDGECEASPCLPATLKLNIGWQRALQRYFEAGLDVNSWGTFVDETGRKTVFFFVLLVVVMSNTRTEVYLKERNDNGVDNLASTSDDGSTLKPDLVISVQPQPNDSYRAELPVTTENWRTNPRGQFIPVHGLDFLIGVTSLLIQQTVEIDDLISKVESENRYIVRVPHGEALYIATESSSQTQRCLCGSGRAFLMHLHDSTRQEAIVLKRRLAAASCCFPCRLQEMKVITPPGDYVGRVVQRWSVVPSYLVRDLNDQVLFALEGPAVLQRSALMLSEFKIMTGDSLREVGKISHGWDRDLNSFATTVQVPNATVQPKHKALLLGAAFLLEYTYFMKSKTSCMRCCC
ncbi:uncharacterized protein LOC128677665 [Plodia interpunctella]|uniref:uncharacterized protein LOC128677665 n=1 Tax=Plodia interpunctella TaxID=58824 RepID=UPI0023678132|nr:uncharacterized protein LOC128677665 [Plodia interpunctella]